MSSEAGDRDLLGLLRFLEERACMPFAFGRDGNDCVAFAGGAVEAQTGVDPLADLQWSTIEEARALLKAEGGMRAALDRRFRRVPPAMAQRGDIAGVACASFVPAAAGQPGRGFGTRLMVVEGDTLAGPGERGIRRMPRAAMAAAWSASSPKRGAR